MSAGARSTSATTTPGRSPRRWRPSPIGGPPIRSARPCSPASTWPSSSQPWRMSKPAARSAATCWCPGRRPPFARDAPPRPQHAVAQSGQRYQRTSLRFESKPYVEDAKKLLRLEDRQLQAILSIAFEVGFNSNSAFYAAFKKSCGQTPAQYRQAEKS